MQVRTAIAIWPQRLLGSALVVTCALIVALGTAPKAAALEPCGKAGYSYAGFQSASRGFGVRATLMALANPEVRSGHVAAWVGLGGAGLGPNGSDQWLQVGLSAFHGTGSNLYYEVATGGAEPRYHEIDSTVSSGERQRVAVLELATRPNWWRVWVNDKPVSKPIHLSGSSGRYQPIATAETWDGGAPVCNRFAYRFAGLAVAAARGGSWHRFVQAHRFEERGYRVTASTSSFDAVVK